ncbi:MAG: Nramp family divalent metal transporter, partial [Planctomycetota bacterium]
MRGTHPPRWIAAVGPGLLVAATGVGAGDLATAGFAASKLGYAILWAIVVGAAVKFMLTEGLARWQLATGATLIEGVRHRLGPIPIALFLLYLVAWCYFVGVALVKASGVATQALLPLPFELGTSSESAGPLVYGAACSILGLAVAWLGGFRWFERVMGVCIAVMFLTTIISAIAVRPDWSAVATGLLVPRIPEGGTNWTIALMGGVGGTVTVLAYGYWIRQVDGERERGIGLMRLDLAVGYVATAVFGIAVAILAVGVPTEGAGVRLITGLADRLGEAIGPGLRALFLVGVWAAIVSSLIGVW